MQDGKWALRLQFNCIYWLQQVGIGFGGAGGDGDDAKACVLKVVQLCPILVCYTGGINVTTARCFCGNLFKRYFVIIYIIQP